MSSERELTDVLLALGARRRGHARPRARARTRGRHPRRRGPSPCDPASRPWITLALALSLVASLSPGAEAHAQSPDVSGAQDPDELTKQAVRHFQSKDYDGAVQLFEQAYAIDPNPNYLFNIGRVYEESGQIKQAVEYYQRFIQQPGVDLESRQRAVERLRVLRAVLAETEGPPPEQPPPEPETPTEDPKDETTEPAQPEGPEEGATTTLPPEEDEPPRKISGLEIAGYTVLGLGGGALIAGAVFGGLALGQEQELDSQNVYENRQEIIDSGTTNALVADILFISGGVLAVSGLVMALVGRSKRKRQARRESVASRPGITFRSGRELSLVYHF